MFLGIIQSGYSVIGSLLDIWRMMGLKQIPQIIDLVAICMKNFTEEYPSNLED